MKMSESFLLTFLRDVYTQNVDYCIVCLRTSQERRLEKPNYVKKFISSINQPFTMNGPHHLACYVCERQAAAAFRYRAATNLATFALSIMNSLKKSNKQCTMVETCSADKKNQAWLSKVLDCESRIMQQRARTQMLLTEVLVVSTTDEANLGDPEDRYVVPDDVPSDSALMSELTKDTVNISSIIIDDDDPIAIKNEPSNDISPNYFEDVQTALTTNALTSLVPIQKLLDEPIVGDMSLLDKNTVIEASSIAPTNYTLHPIVINKGRATVPSLNANLLNGKLVVSNIEASEVYTPQIAVQVGDNLELMAVQDNVTNVLSLLSNHDESLVHTGSNQIASQGNRIAPKNGMIKEKVAHRGKNAARRIAPRNEIIKEKVAPLSGMASHLANSVTENSGYFAVVMNPLPNTNPSLGKNSSLLRNSLESHLASSVTENSGCTAVVTNPLPTKNPSLGKSPSLGENPSSRQHPPAEQVRKLAVLHTDRIDWEDKIPMDVISFVDENDSSSKRPRYSECGPPPLGIICNVTSLNTDDVIDLC